MTGTLLKYIVNRSSKPLDFQHLKVLSKGLNFSPTPYITPNYQPAIDRVSRTIRLRYYFGLDNPPSKSLPFKQRNAWNPPLAPQFVENYLESLSNRIGEIPPQRFPHNMSRQERLALSQLSNDPSLTIKKADKGSCVVVENTSDYIGDGLKHLDNRDIYEPINEDYTESLSKAINLLVKNAETKGHLNKHMASYLTHDSVTEVRTQQLYFLKKLHKTPVSVRPIVSGCSGPTENCSAFLDFYLQPLVPLSKSYIRDSKHMIQILEDVTLPQNAILATVDVEALYLNIPHSEGIECALSNLYEHNPDRDSLPFPKDFVEGLLTAILKHNIFEFDGKMYRQTRGTAMGTKAAPSYANLFMAQLEESFLATQDIKPVIWKRLIDDIFIVWTSTRESLEKFLSDLNKFHPTLKFTWKISDTSVDFLDLLISKGNRFKNSGVLDIELFLKPTNKFQYLAYSSCHPLAVRRGLVKGEVIRTLRASSSEGAFLSTTKLLARHIVQRGYPRKLVRDVLGDISFEDRKEALAERALETSMQPPAFVCAFHPQIGHRLLKAAICPPESTGIPVPRICYRRNTNISDRLVRARVRGSEAPKKGDLKISLRKTLTWRICSSPCGNKNCLCCKAMSRKETVFSSDGSHSYRVPVNTTCSTRNSIYVLECTQCTTRNLYVGQTLRPVRERLSGHRAMWQTKNMPLYRHLKRPNHNFDKLKLTVLETVEDPSQLDAREVHWIKTLDTVLPNGLNSKFFKGNPI